LKFVHHQSKEAAIALHVAHALITTHLAGVPSSCCCPPPVAGLKLLPPAGVVEGGGLLINSRCGLSRTGSSSAAAGEPDRAFAVAAVASAAAAGLAAADRLKGELPPTR
jgi:hypothetical protein